MKLKLNRTLRAALIAAVTAVGFSISQAATYVWDGDAGDGKWSTPNNWNLNNGYYPQSNNDYAVINDGTSTVTWSNCGYLGATNTITIGDGNTVLFQPGQADLNVNTYNLQGNAQFLGSSTNAIGFGRDFAINYQDMTKDAHGLFEIQMTAGTLWRNSKKISLLGEFDTTGITEEGEFTIFDISNVQGTSGTITLDISGLTYDDQNGVDVQFIKTNENKVVVHYSVTGPVTSLIWAGTESNNVLTSAVWNDGQSTTAAYSETAPLIFGTDGYKTVAITSDATAKSMEIQGGDYVFANGASLTVKTLTVAEGASLTTSGSGTMTINALTGAGDLVKGDSGTMALNGVNAGFTGDLTVNAGTLSITKASSLGTGTHTVASGAVIEVTNASMAAVGTLTVTGEGTVRLVTTSRSESGNALGTLTAPNLELADNSDHTGRYYYGGSTDISGVGNLKFAGGQLWLTSDMTYGGGVTFGTTTYTESNDFAGAAMRVNASGTFNGAVVVQGTAKLVWGESNKTLAFNDTVTGSGNIDLIGWNGKTGTVKISGNASAYAGAMTTNDKITLNVTSTGSLSIGSGSSLAGAVALDGALTVNGAATISGNITGEGSLAKTGEGELILSGGSNVLGNAITLNGGTLSLTGAFNLDALTVQGGTEYVGDGGITIPTGSGFAKTSGTITVVDKQGGTLNIGQDATFSYNSQAVTVNSETGIVTLSGEVDYTSLWVNGTDPVSYNAAQTLAGDTTVGTVHLNCEGATINMDSAGASVGLVLAEGTGHATVNATAATTISSISGWSGNGLSIEGEGTVALPNQTLSLTSGMDLEIGANVTAQKVQLNSDDVSLYVKSNGSLTTSNNLTLTKGEANVDGGEVNIGHELDLSDGNQATGELRITNHGSVTAKDGMWMATTAAGVLLEEDATFAITGKGVKFTGKEGDGLIKASNAEINYSADNANAVVSNVIMEAIGNITIGNTLENVDVVTGAHTVTLNSDADSVTVNTDGTFTKGDSVTVGKITVEDGGTIAGGVDATDVTIKAGATGTFDEGITDAEAMIYIGNAIEGSPTITNKSETDAKYAGLQDESMSVTADFLESYASGDSPVVVNNELFVKSIAHEGTGELTLAHVNADTLEGVYAYDGALSLQNITEVSLTEMTIAPEATVAVYQGDLADANQEGTVTITDTLTAGGGTLLANLTIVGGAEDAFQWDLGGTTMTLGSTLTLMTVDGLIQLDDETMQNIADMQVGDFYELVLEKEGSSLNYEGGNWWDEVFTRSYGGENALALVGDYQVGLLDNGSFGVTKFSNVPEPTTGTLSLLALAALAARRRRK